MNPIGIDAWALAVLRWGVRRAPLTPGAPVSWLLGPQVPKPRKADAMPHWFIDESASVDWADLERRLVGEVKTRRVQMKQYLVVFRRAGTENWYALESSRRLLDYSDAMALIHKLYVNSTVSAATQYGLAKIEFVTVPVRANIVPFDESVVSL